MGMVRSAKKPTDANAPKRPLSAYFLWTGENRASYVNKNPGQSIGEIGKAMGKAWGNLSEAAKKPYIAAAEKAKEAYLKRREKYMKSASYKKHQEAVAEWKKNEAKKPFHKDPHRPSRPASGYLLFVNAERPSLMKSGLSVTEVAKAASKKWNDMSDGDKEKWNKKSAALKSKYDKEIATYEKSSKHISYMAEKEKYNEERDAKRQRSVSASGGANKKVKRSASKSRSTKRRSSVPKAAKRARSRSVSRKRSGKKAA